MRPDKSEFVEKRLAHARTTLDEVDIQIENGLWNVAVNRLYYACFYAVSALIHNENMESKTHSGTHRLFNQHFVKPGIVSEASAKLYTRLMNMRQDADYEDTVEYDEDDVLKLRQPAIELISEIERILAIT